MSDQFIEGETAGGPWDLAVGRRLAIAVSDIGKDEAQRITGKSWKQLQRYFRGDEPPAGVIKALAKAADASLAWLMDGYVQVGKDAELAGRLVEEDLAQARLLFARATFAAERESLEGQVHRLSHEGDQYSRLAASLADLPRYPSSPDDRFQSSRLREEAIDPGGALAPGRGVVPPPPGLDEHLHGLVVEGIMTVYKDMGARLAPRDLGRLAARIHGELLADCDTPDERLGGLKVALKQLRRELGTADGTSGKRLA